MINYVNNSFDKVLKPCDAQKFMELTQMILFSHRLHRLTQSTHRYTRVCRRSRVLSSRRCGGEATRKSLWIL